MKLPERSSLHWHCFRDNDKEELPCFDRIQTPSTDNHKKNFGGRDLVDYNQQPAVKSVKSVNRFHKASTLTVLFWSEKTTLLASLSSGEE